MAKTKLSSKRKSRQEGKLRGKKKEGKGEKKLALKDASGGDKIFQLGEEPHISIKEI